VRFCEIRFRLSENAKRMGILRNLIHSIAKRNVGKDVSLLVADIERFESTGQKRDNTWGKRGDKEANR
jgi:hypothetical protein